MSEIGDWDGFLQRLDPVKFKNRLDRNLSVAARRIGMQFQAEARRRIRAEVYAPNSPITIAIKGSSTPLVARDSRLFKGLSFEALHGGRTVRVGVMRKAGDELVNVAEILHEGATVDVAMYPEVRAAVFAKMREAGGGRARAIAREQLTTGGFSRRNDLWIIPGRPYITSVIDDQKFRRFARDTWRNAVKAALFGR